MPILTEADQLEALRLINKLQAEVAELKHLLAKATAKVA